jgi:hypothetical protein
VSSIFARRRALALATKLCAIAATLTGCVEGERAFLGVLRVIVLVTLAVSAVAALVYIALWVALVVTLSRGGRWSAVVIAALLCVEHGAVLAWQLDADSRLSIALCVSGAAPLAALLATLLRLRAAPERRVSRALLCVAAIVAYEALVFGVWLAPPWSPARPIRAAAASSNHRCVIDAKGQVGCDGANSSGELGARDSNARRMVRVRTVDDAVDVAVDVGVSCALRRRGTVACWGGERLGSPAPAGDVWTVPASEGTRAIAVAEDAVYGLRADGSAWSFPRRMPASMSRAIELAAAREHVCVITPSRAVACAAFGRRAGEYEVAAAAGAESIAVGIFGSGCAVVRGRDVCWTLDADRQLSLRDATASDRVAVRRFGDARYAWLLRDGSVIADTLMGGSIVIATQMRSIARGGVRTICGTSTDSAYRCFSTERDAATERLLELER